MAERSREDSRKRSEIGAIPKCKRPRRKAACKWNLMKFLTTYFPNSTGKNPFSKDHKRIVARIQNCILHGGRQLNALYRGFGKTTMSENSAIWGTFYGHRKYPAIFGADKELADEIIESIKTELEENDLLFEDFPEVCFPIRALEGRPQRCGSQTCGGELTHIEWTADRIVLPTIEGSDASGAIIRTKGLHGNARGFKFKRTDGTQQRPDLVLIDDPQTDELAGSPDQVRKLLNKIKRSILKLGGHNETLAVVMNATVIEEEDVVDQLLDHKRNPSWQGERIPMIRQWAKRHDDFWLEKYATIRNDYDEEIPGDQLRAWKEATALYKKHQKAADTGCRVGWKYCFDPKTEISAIQHAYNALIDDGEDVFASEFQNQPLPPDDYDEDVVTVEQIITKTNGHAQLLVPKSCSFLTATIDVQKWLLYYVVTGWENDFTGFVVDYGTWPDQKQAYFKYRDVRNSPGALQAAAKTAGLKAGMEAAIYHGLGQLTDQLLGTEWNRDGGGVMDIDLCPIDAGYGDSTDIVYEFCRQSEYSARLIPSHGRGIEASDDPITRWKKRPGDRFGLNWTIPGSRVRRAVRHLLFDTNYWKSFLQSRWSTPMGDPGCLSLFEPKTATRKRHRMIAEQVTAENRILQVGKKRKVYVWRNPKRQPDNHFLDCLVGSAVAASITGATVAAIGKGDGSNKKGKKLKLSELQKQRRERSGR